MFRGELGPEFERDDVSCESSLAKDVNSCSCGGDWDELLAIGGMVCKKRTHQLHQISSHKLVKTLLASHQFVANVKNCAGQSV